MIERGSPLFEFASHYTKYIALHPCDTFQIVVFNYGRDDFEYMDKFVLERGTSLIKQHPKEIFKVGLWTSTARQFGRFRVWLRETNRLIGEGRFYADLRIGAKTLRFHQMIRGGDPELDAAFVYCFVLRTVPRGGLHSAKYIYFLHHRSDLFGPYAQRVECHVAYDLVKKPEEHKSMAEVKTEIKKVDRLYVAFDIEKEGAMFNHRIIQIGVAWSTRRDAKFETASFCFQRDPENMEKRCWDEFWSKHQATLKRIDKEAQPQAEQWKKFSEFLDDLEKLSDDIEILSDNPLYDLAAIDHELHQRGLRDLSLRYTRSVGYRAVKDPSERIKGLSLFFRSDIDTYLAQHCPHTHWAPDDAREILMMYFLVQEAIKICDTDEYADTALPRWQVVMESKPV